ncbi:MAG: endonuclease III [Limnochordia bacterium]|jgi:endonuclease-3|nr:endonuclease III [Bacillota bacterium]NLL09208.1 endonuclease III [Bacillota bacterium]HBG09845.1 endonuclease III [Bacillota bacterium]
MLEVLKILKSMYPNARTELRHDSPFQLLVATILSAQCTDERVNQITAELFPAFPTARHLAAASFAEVANYVRSAGLWRSKTNNLLKTAQILVEKYDGEVPQTREELEALPGVGRKTANVVLANAFGIPAIAVDTHVFRVANRLGLSNGSTPLQVEQQLMEVIPEEEWISAHHWLIRHGRALCKARKPLCDRCPLQPHCRYFQEN